MMNDKFQLCSRCSYHLKQSVDNARIQSGHFSNYSQNNYEHQIQMSIISLMEKRQYRLANRGSQKLDSKLYDLENGIATFNETLSIQSSAFMDDKKDFLEKKSMFTVLIQAPQGTKTAGIVNFDFAPYLNQKLPTITETFKLDKCPDKNATMVVKFNFKILQELDIDMMSNTQSQTQSVTSYQNLSEKDDKNTKQPSTSKEQSMDMSQQDDSAKKDLSQTGKNQNLEYKIAEMNAIIGQLQDKLSKQVVNVEQHNELLKQKDMEINNLKQKIQILEEHERDDSQNKMIQIKTQYEEKLHQNQLQINQIQQQLEKEQQNHNDTIKQLHSLELKQQLEFDVNKRQIEEIKITYETQTREAQSKYQQINEESCKDKVLLKVLNEKNQTLISEMNVLRIQLQELQNQQQIKGIQADAIINLQYLQEQLKTKDDRIHDLEVSLRQFDSINKQLQLKIDTQALESSLKLEQLDKNYKNQIINLNKQLEHKDVNHFNINQQTKSQYEERVRHLEQQNNDLISQLEIIQQSFGQIKDQNNSLQSQLELTSKNLSSSRLEYNQIINQQNTDKIAEFQKQIQDLTQQLTQYQLNENENKNINSQRQDQNMSEQQQQAYELKINDLQNQIKLKKVISMGLNKYMKPKLLAMLKQINDQNQVNEQQSIQINTYQAKINELQSYQQELEQQGNILKAQLTNLQSQISQNNKQIQELQTQIEKSNTSNSQYENQIIQLKEEIKQKEAEFQKSQNDLKYNTEYVQNQQNQLKQQELLCNQQASEIQLLKQQLEQSDQNLKNFQNELLNTSQSNDETTNQLKQVISKYQQQIEELTKKQQEDIHKINNLEIQNKDLYDLIESNYKTIQQSKVQLEQSQNKLTSREQVINQQQQQQQTQQQQIQLLQDKLQQHLTNQASESQLHTDLDKINQQLLTKDKQLVELKQNQQLAIIELQGKLDQKIAEVQQLESQIELLKQFEQLSNQKIQVYEADIKELQEYKEKFISLQCQTVNDQRVSDLQKKLEAKELELQEINKQLISQKQNFDDQEKLLQQQIENKEELIRQYQTEKEQIQGENQQLKSTIDLSDKVLKEYNHEVGKIQSQIQENQEMSTQMSFVENPKYQDFYNQLSTLKKSIAIKLDQYQKTINKLQIESVTQYKQYQAEELNFKDKEIEGLQHQLQQKQLELKKIEESTHHLKGQNTKIESEQKVLITQLKEDFRTQMNSLTQQNELLKEQYKQKCQAFDRQQVTIDSIRQEQDQLINKLQYDYQNQVQEYDEKLKQRENEIEVVKTNLEARILKLEDNIQFFTQQDLEQKDLIQFLEGIKDKLETKEQSQTDYLQTLQTRNAELISDNEFMEQQIIQLKQQLTVLQEGYDQIQKRQVEILNENNEISKQFKELSKQYAILEKEKLSLSQHYQLAMTNQLEISGITNNEVDPRIDQMQEEIIKLKCQIGEIFNIAFDQGGPILVDKLQQALGIRE
ncbi:hypothetical protein pb186bvf_015165 [Paramecium bursaria]